MDPSPAAGGPSGSVSPAVCLPSPGSHEPPRSLPEEPERLGAQGVRTRLCQGLRRVSSAAPRKAPDVRQAAMPRSALPGSATVASAHGRDNRGPGPLGHRTSGLAKGNPCRLFANVSLCRPVLGREAWMRDEKRGGDVRIPTSRASQWSLVRRSERAQEAAS